MNDLEILERYKLLPTELFVIRAILLAKENNEYEWIQRFVQLLNSLNLKLRDLLVSLINKGIILKSWKLPKEGDNLIIEDIPFNQNFLKQYHRSSFDLGNELFETYPQFTYVQGQYYNLRRVSKKFNDLEDAFAKYGKVIKWNNYTHQEILELINWGKDNQYNFTTLDDFICDRGWLSIKAQKDGKGININTEAVKMI